jgi:hypothetical protein
MNDISIITDNRSRILGESVAISLNHTQTKNYEDGIQ